MNRVSILRPDFTSAEVLTGIAEMNLLLAAVGLLGAPASRGRLPWSRLCQGSRARSRMPGCWCGVGVWLLWADKHRFGNVGFLTKQ